MCEDLIALKRRAIAEGRERLLAARALLEKEASEIDARAKARLGLHRAWALDPSAIATLAVDMLPGFVALGDFRAALDLLDWADDVFPPYRALVARDPELELLRRDAEAGPALTVWLRRTE